MHSATPGMAARARVVSGRSSREMAIRSRSSMGAVLWFTPMRARRHGAPNLCTWLKRLAAQTAIITTKHGAGDIGGLAAAQAGAAADEQEEHIDCPA